MPPIFQADTLDATTAMSATGLFDCANWITLGAALAVAAYPFLPSTRRPIIRREIFLIWPSGLGLAFISCINTLAWGFGQPYVHLQPWQSILLGYSALAGAGLLSRNPKREDFKLSAHFAFTIFFTVLCDRLHYFFLLKDDKADSLEYFGRSLAWGISTFGIGLLTYGVFMHLATTAFYQFATRRVSWWYWLPENGAEEDFMPFWSISLANLVLLAPPVLLVAASFCVSAG
jgi:hypothetical protein